VKWLIGESVDRWIGGLLSWLLDRLIDRLVVKHEDRGTGELAKRMEVGVRAAGD